MTPDKEQVVEPLSAALTFADFAATNRSRCESPEGFGHPLSGWTRSDWITAAVGEFGEAANVAKKLNRVRDGIPGNDHTEAELRSMLADEYADAVIYLDLAAQADGIDLGSAIATKFNRTSEKIGAPHRLDAARTASVAGLDRALRDELTIAHDALDYLYRTASKAEPLTAVLITIAETAKDSRDRIAALNSAPSIEQEPGETLRAAVRWVLSDFNQDPTDDYLDGVALPAIRAALEADPQETERPGRDDLPTIDPVDNGRNDR